LRPRCRLRARPPRRASPWGSRGERAAAQRHTMESVKQKEEMALAEARRIAATRIAAAHRGKKARESIKEEHEAAAKLQAVHRGQAVRRRKFVLAEAQHTKSDPAFAPPPLANDRPLSLKQLGLKHGLPKNPVPELRFLTFFSWWTEMGTKRYAELCFDLESELFQVVLDKQVNVLDAKKVYSANYESLFAVVDKDTKVMSMHLHEKLSGNQHAESLRRKHLECWDLHVGCKLNVLGRPTTLMQANLVTGQWLEYHAERLLRIKGALEESLLKYETVPMAAAFVSQKGKNLNGSNGHSASKGNGTTDLRTILNQIEALSMQLQRYRPAIAVGLAKLADPRGSGL